MGRKRSAENANLPKGMIFNKKGNTYYLRASGQKDIRLGKTLSEAFRNYYAYASINFECQTMHDLIDRYLKEISPTKAESTHKSNISASKHLIKRFGHMNPRVLRARHAYQYLDLRNREGAPVRGNREFALLSTIMSHAVRWGVIDDTPFHGIIRNPEQPRDRLVTDDELAVFVKYCPRWLQLYVALKLATGLRQTDMLKLSSKDWDDEKGLKVQASKTGSRLQFEAVDHLSFIISELKQINGYRTTRKHRTPLLHWYFFASSANARKEQALTPDGFRTAWNKAMRAAIESGDLQPEQRFQDRDLRAKTASECETITQAFELLGHSSVATTKRVYRRGYSQVTPVTPKSPDDKKKQSIEK
ncbi:MULTISPECIES: tyrosine-type recombinase/integrase [Pseudoalteromonas]|uniref:Tyrosine-type recombinase/integrase n=2 Tax=Pseudoalteromonas TaxID=53246 RepID=A0A8I2HCD0_9GAMM|nr:MULTISPECIES: tyrosine-type recombinase/integrase [Pseudoalteromonas]MCP4586884.1 tyrosine-type recombinase/integrase [Pseudoalteromonas sp.]NLR22980.1 tyrosine-type recombinase/integrase [Pseudoalteromonas maricaloris]WMO12648.1 tyrosine-type recombinase/integrase [Pseudoalteromonas piscicida]WOX27885.1 tyrosine-type recombinase/integrase [Pseudoalteromonas maricaloris]